MCIKSLTSSEIKDHIDNGSVVQMTGSKSVEFDGEQSTEVYYECVLRERGV